MRLIVIILIILLSYPINIYSATTDPISLLEQFAQRGEYRAMYWQARILYEQGVETEAIKYLNIACFEGRESDACNYLKYKNQYIPKNETITKNTNEIDKHKIFCEYTDVKDKSVGISTMSMGATTGIPWLDGLNTIVGLMDDARDYFHTHTYICSYSPIREGQDTEFKKDIDNKEIKYIVFYKGALKHYYKLYSTHQIRENTIYPKTVVDYIGVIDKNNKILRLDTVRDGKIYPSTSNDLENLKKYKLEE